MEEWQKRVEELAQRAYMKGIAIFSDFLSEGKCEEINKMSLPVPVMFWGGAEYAERKMVRFCGDGNKKEFSGEFEEENIYAAKDFPIIIIKITPLSKKYASPLTHRDFLGAILGAGVERDKIGDIFTDGFCAYVVTDKKIGEYLSVEIDKVGRNPVKTEIADKIDDEFLPKTEEKEVLVSSLRADCVLSAVYKISRDKSLELFSSSFVSINGRVCENNSSEVKENQVFSVRGYGKFVFFGVSGTSAKGRKYIKVGIYR